MRLRPRSLWPLLVLSAAVAAGCEEPAEMEIDSDSTMANPGQMERTIPENAVRRDAEGTETTSEEVAGAERDAAGPSQEESLAGAYNLEDFRGRNVLLVFAGSPDVPEYERLKAAWRENAAAVGQRNLALVESLLRGRSPEATKTLPEGESQVLRSRYGIQPPQFKVLLIGPEGTVIEEGEDLTLDAALERLGRGEAEGDAATAE
ncbi:MAG TPA: DUF4174 domain-containing protein [Planctomycetaceae bacterium]